MLTRGTGRELGRDKDCFGSVLDLGGFWIARAVGSRGFSCTVLYACIEDERDFALLTSPLIPMNELQ